MIMRDAVAEGSGNFDHPGFFNEHRRRTVYMAQHFASNQMQPPRPGFDHAAFGSSAIATRSPWRGCNDE